MTDRHQGDQQPAELMEVCQGKYLFNQKKISLQSVNDLCEPVGEDEENALSVTVTADMTREDVVAKILDLVK